VIVSAQIDKYQTILPHLNERQVRLLLATDAKVWGYGGITKVQQSSGRAQSTIRRGIKELDKINHLKVGRSRNAGGGRKKIEDIQPGISQALDKLVEPESRGDPESRLRWTVKSTRELAKELVNQGYKISHSKVGQILSEEDYSLQGNAKVKEGDTHQDRDAQFGYINKKAKKYLKENDPVISVDTKKKELIGSYKNNGKTWEPKGSPVKVNVHDFPDKEKGKAVPYGIYDQGQNEGWVNVGVSKDTAKFAKESIYRWWQKLGKKRYSQAKRLLITADSGGSNSRRSRLWKQEIQDLANETGLRITVCHYPPGTSKWNKIEHRLFSYITMNWKGRPLTSVQMIVNLIGSTKTHTGLKVYATVDRNIYETGIKVTDEQMKQINLVPHKFHCDWNYTIVPNS
jgi:hypothetical protein